VTTINFNDIAQALESMKRQPDRQYDLQDLYSVVPMKNLCYFIIVDNNKIIIFENAQNQAGA
jgi:predicted nucleic acid-binding protein